MGIPFFQTTNDSKPGKSSKREVTAAADCHPHIKDRALMVL
jgi:hypothetical protein